MALTTTLQIRIEPKERRRWKKEAQERGLTLAGFLRAAIHEFLRPKTPPSENDAVSRGKTSGRRE